MPNGRVGDAGMTPSRDIARLIELMAALRTPGSGCPWDLEQSFATIAPYTIEEAYEVAEAIARGDLEDLRDELGDLLLQVAFHARMAEEAGAFDFGDVVHAITAKLLRRHPHVFGDAGALPVAAVNELWDRIKGEEKAALARHVGADPETALRATNAKFERRFAAIERALAARSKSPRQSTLTEMDALWDAAKAAEREKK